MSVSGRNGRVPFSSVSVSVGSGNWLIACSIWCGSYRPALQKRPDMAKKWQPEAALATKVAVAFAINEVLFLALDTSVKCKPATTATATKVKAAITKCRKAWYPRRLLGMRLVQQLDELLGSPFLALCTIDHSVKTKAEVQSVERVRHCLLYHYLHFRCR